MGCYYSVPTWGLPSHNITGTFTNPSGINMESKVSTPSVLPPRVKLVLLGDSGVGKSAIALRYVKGQFSATSHITVGASFLTKEVQVPSGKPVKFEIWDTAGQERYFSLAPLYYRGAHAAAVVYDVTNAQTFSKAQFWVNELQQNALPGIVVVLVGNKTDLVNKREVLEEKARDYAYRCKMMFVETSAKDGSNISEVFESVATKLAGGLPISSNATVI